MTVPWLGRLVAGPSPRRHCFDPKSDVQSNSEKCFYPSTSVVSYQDHCTNSPCSARLYVALTRRAKVRRL